MCEEPVFDAAARWETVRRVLTVPSYQYVALREPDVPEHTPGLGSRLGVRTKRAVHFDDSALSPRSDVAIWGGSDFAHMSSPLIRLHRDSYQGLDDASKSPFRERFGLALPAHLVRRLRSRRPLFHSV